MDIHVIPTKLPGVVIVETDFVRDDRGFFIESYHRQHYAAQGVSDEFVQDNHSRSRRGVLRGIHYQDLSMPMAKLVRCTAGHVFDVAVDLRVGSPTFGQWAGVELSVENMKQVYVPVGFGHAFLTLSETADVQYRCTNYYAPAAEGCIAWNDPDIAVAWPLDGGPLLSARDSNGISLRAYAQNPAFRWAATGATIPHQP
jgi:dTDP-4-dehydrorhamnose 3,5-epimerase